MKPADWKDFLNEQPLPEKNGTGGTVITTVHWKSISHLSSRLRKEFSN
jgi:hypothetical protein